ncbi:hypothetical protein UCREL1_4874 [Eutypa lata UCREL1]|uniref:Uncharacterized protein n=1 Tax=Eutypa lata (strain UCR-EL1) TaxID=1287681 RepID=M7SV45_EUTLA|nr:hypothetical protein UCREL1_4874 [Eutypa lata UCREL1]
MELSESLNHTRFHKRIEHKRIGAAEATRASQAVAIDGEIQKPYMRLVPFDDRAVALVLACLWSGVPP